MKYDAILFDLDGTLVDSAVDLLITLDNLLIKYGRKTCDHDTYRQHISDGSLRLLEMGFNEDYPIEKALLRQEFLRNYQIQNTKNTNFFQGIEALLQSIEKSHTPWGVVTNKYTEPTSSIAKHLQLDKRAVAIVCGDTLPVEKPDPSPIILACEMIGVNPKNCVYIGDSYSDITAGKLAEMATIACAYGYIKADDDINSWGADHIVNNPTDILPLLVN